MKEERMITMVTFDREGVLTFDAWPDVLGMISSALPERLVRIRSVGRGDVLVTVDRGRVEAVVLDQFVGPTPYSLSQQPIAWDAFLADVRAGVYDGDVPWAKGQIARLPLHYDPHMATTVYREVDGKVAIWKTRWDSSG
jgi:hypothetical protein